MSAVELFRLVVRDPLFHDFAVLAAVLTCLYTTILLSRTVDALCSLRSSMATETGSEENGPLRGGTMIPQIQSAERPGSTRTPGTRT